MDSDRVIKAMARWWQVVINEDADLNARDPMLYDPLQQEQIKTSTQMQYVAAVVICLGAISAGTALAWTSPVLPQIELFSEVNSTNNPYVTENLTSLNLETRQSLKITANEGTLIASLIAFGAIFGAVPSGIIADRIGRKYTAIIMDLPFIISWALIIIANSPLMLYIGRFLIGISTGAFCVIAPMYISEISETKIRGSLGTFFQLFLTIGILFTYLIGSQVQWRTLSAICLIFPVILFIGMCFLPETPIFLLKKGRRGAAALSIKWLWGKYCDSRCAIQSIQNDLDSISAETSILDLFTVKSNLNGLFISLALMLFQQFSGINAVIFYSASIFQSAGSSLSPSLCTIIVGCVQVATTFISTLLIDRLGRRILLLISSSIMGICLFLLGIYFTLLENNSDFITSIGWLPLLSVVLFIITFSLGFGPIPWLIMGELFMPDVKGMAVSLTVTFNWIAVFVVTNCFGVLTEFGKPYPFWFFASFMGIGCSFVLFYVFETKGKSPTQIQIILSRNNKE